jgi:hypothetical protein
MSFNYINPTPSHFEQTDTRIITANILGIFYSPFEFAGQYGSEMDLLRKEIFDLILPREPFARNLADDEAKERLLQEAMQWDANYGPTIEELIPEEMIFALREKQKELQDPSFTEEDLERFIDFLQKYKDQKAFHFLHNTPAGSLGLELALRNDAAFSGKNLELSILDSPKLLEGKNSLELKKNALDELLSKHVLNDLTKGSEAQQKMLNKIPPDYLSRYLGKEAQTKDLDFLLTRSGQPLFFWFYHTLNLHLISQDPNLIEKVNRVKTIFADTIGNPKTRAALFKKRVDENGFGVVLTQECDRMVVEAFATDFWPLDGQNQTSGTFVFLKKDLWEKPEPLTIDAPYEGLRKGKVNPVLAKNKITGEMFLFAACHGDSNDASDGRYQVRLVKEKFDELQKLYPELNLVIGIDANTKSEEQVAALRDELDELGLEATNVGPTTIKQRMLTAQSHKTARFARDEEDFLITLKGGKYKLANPLVGFSQEKPDPNRCLPDIGNPSDHYSVGATLEKRDN